MGPLEGVLAGATCESGSGLRILEDSRKIKQQRKESPPFAQKTREQQGAHSRKARKLSGYNSGMVRIVWEFHVKPGREEEFELFYNGEGLWALLFRKSPDYFGTKLMRDLNTPGRYITVDKWDADYAFAEFKKTVEFEYNAIDRKCEELTESERLLGVFEEI
jgi:heme-degrading monooxygenase HmoA